MDEIYFHLSRHFEALQVQLQWGLQQTRQLGVAWGSSARSSLDVFQNGQWHEQLKQFAEGLKNAARHASTALAQPAEVYNQLFQLVRIEMPILYPGGAGFLTGAAIGIIIGLSIQRPPVPVQRMKAVVCLAYDGLDSLSCIDDFIVPTVMQRNQVLIQVKAASVDIIDIRICAGYGKTLRGIFSPKTPNTRQGFPVTLGRDCSGVIVEIGSGVQKLEIGDEVWAVSPFWSTGTISEFVLLPDYLVAKKPRGVGFEGAASLPYAGSLAFSACLRGGILSPSQSRRRVLIQSGVSPVGCIACQIARSEGWEVTVTCSSRAAPVARALGATDVVAYGQMDQEDQLTKDRFDVVINTVGGVSYESCEMLCKPDGKVVSTVPEPIASDNFGFPLSFFHGLYVRTKVVLKKLTGSANQWTDVEFSSEVLDQLSVLVDKGHVQPVVDKVFAPQDSILALQHCDSVDAIGKTIIRFRCRMTAVTPPCTYHFMVSKYEAAFLPIRHSDPNRTTIRSADINLASLQDAFSLNIAFGFSIRSLSLTSREALSDRPTVSVGKVLLGNFLSK